MLLGQLLQWFRDIFSVPLPIDSDANIVRAYTGAYIMELIRTILLSDNFGDCI